MLGFFVFKNTFILSVINFIKHKMLKEISPVEEEKIIVANDFGTVSTTSVMLKVSNTEASIPLKQIYSISFRRKHNFSLGIFYLFISIAVLI